LERGKQKIEKQREGLTDGRTQRRWTGKGYSDKQLPLSIPVQKDNGTTGSERNIGKKIIFG